MQKKKLGWLAALVLLAMSAGMAHAQFPDGPPPGGPPDGDGPPGMSERGPGAQRELKTLTKVLSLTSDQQAGVKGILEQQATQMRALFAKRQSNGKSDQDEGNTQEARQAMTAQIQQLRDDSNTRIAALLNDSQKQTFADWLAKRKAQMEKRRQQDGGDGPPPPPPDGGGPPPGE